MLLYYTAQVIVPLIAGWVIVTMVLIPFRKADWWVRASFRWLVLFFCGVVLTIVLVLHYSFFGLAWFFLFIANVLEIPSPGGEVKPKRIAVTGHSSVV